VSSFDRIGHDHILNQVGSFPARGMIRAWLKAGVVENGRLSRTEEGTPQGGVISPALLNLVDPKATTPVHLAVLAEYNRAWDASCARLRGSQRLHPTVNRSLPCTAPEPPRGDPLKS
jgi:hypothetical protein